MWTLQLLHHFAQNELDILTIPISQVAHAKFQQKRPVYSLLFSLIFESTQTLTISITRVVISDQAEQMILCVVAEICSTLSPDFRLWLDTKIT